MVSHLSKNGASDYLVQVVVGDDDLRTWLESFTRSLGLGIVTEASWNDSEDIRIKKLDWNCMKNGIRYENFREFFLARAEVWGAIKAWNFEEKLPQFIDEVWELHTCVIECQACESMVHEMCDYASPWSHQNTSISGPFQCHELHFNIWGKFAQVLLGPVWVLMHFYFWLWDENPIHEVILNHAWNLVHYTYMDHSFCEMFTSSQGVQYAKKVLIWTPEQKVMSLKSVWWPKITIQIILSSKWHIMSSKLSWLSKHNWTLILEMKHPKGWELRELLSFKVRQISLEL